MESGLTFPHRSYIHCQPRKTSSIIHFSTVLSSRNITGERFFSTFCPPAIRGGHLRFQSSGSWKTLNVPKNLAAASARSAGLSADAKMEPEYGECETTSEDVTEFQLSGDETELSEVNYSFLSIRTAKKVVFKVRDVGKEFVMNNVAGVVGLVTMFKHQPEPEVLQVRTAVIEKSDGATAVAQWSATELTMQHAQLARIAIDMNYLVFAFAFIGWVRILEAIVAVFSTNPPVLRRMMQSLYAVDYLTIAWLAHNLRKPVINLLKVDPTDLHRVSLLKTRMWEGLHAFFERQWKLMATVAVARFLVVIANHITPSQWVTTHIKVVWDMMMALPVF